MGIIVDWIDVLIGADAVRRDGRYPFFDESVWNRGVRFEFDRGKSASNLAQHGIHVADAQALWDDEDHLEVPALT